MHYQFVRVELVRLKRFRLVFYFWILGVAFPAIGCNWLCRNFSLFW